MKVALLAEGVDRNPYAELHKHLIHVALLAEGVDRNSEVDKCSEETLESPSSRRAWIEIFSIYQYK